MENRVLGRGVIHSRLAGLRQTSASGMTSWGCGRSICVGGQVGRAGAEEYGWDKCRGYEYPGAIEVGGGRQVWSVWGRTDRMR